MTENFNALVVREIDGGTAIAVEQLTDADLPEGDVTIDIDYSSLNYKDGMALTGAGRIIRDFPMVPGIDCSGTVAASESDRYAVGDPVILTGWSVGERYWGGYTQRQRGRPASVISSRVRNALAPRPPRYSCVSGSRPSVRILRLSLVWPQPVALQRLNTGIRISSRMEGMPRIRTSPLWPLLQKP